MILEIFLHVDKMTKPLLDRIISDLDIILETKFQKFDDLNLMDRLQVMGIKFSILGRYDMGQKIL